jgi:hypothetical protein
MNPLNSIKGVWTAGIVLAIVLGVVGGLGLAGASLLVTGYFDPNKPEPMTWVAVVAGYHLVGLTLAAVIVSLWT